ncbi:MAG: hypothetical protein KDC24_02215 [Saprospiraceae bacterium]|nr:hypothetical protein [Saprospiraceae bacterium]
MKQGSLLWLLFIICALHGFSQQPAGTAMYFDHLSIRDGLSNNTIYSILQDHNGFIWIGTRDGLCRYDGYQFSVFKKDEPAAWHPKGNHVLSIYEDDDFNLWIGLRNGGLQYLDYETQTLVSPTFAGPDTVNWTEISASAFFKDSKDNLWIGTYGMGVLQIDFKNASLHQFHTLSENPKQKIPSNFCFSFVEDGSGKIWMGLADNYLAIYDPGKAKISTFPSHPTDGFSINSFDKSLLIVDDKIWVGTEGNGIYLIDAKTKTVSNHLLPGLLVKDLILDTLSNQVIAATDGAGLFVFDEKGKQLDNYTYSSSLQNSLNSNALYKLYLDRDQNLWIGTFNGGLNIQKANKARFFSYLNTNLEEESPGEKSVLSFCESKNGTIWIGTDGGGLLKFDEKTGDFSKATFRGGGPKIITTIFEDNTTGVLWLGTFNEGLVRYEPAIGTIKRYLHEENNGNSLFNNNVWAIESARGGKLWLGLLGGGVQLFDPQGNTFKTYYNIPDDPTSLSGWNVRALQIDAQNRLWIGTEFTGMNVKNPGAHDFTRLNTENGSGFPSNSILCFLEDGPYLWIGTEGDGLIRYNKQTGANVVYNTQSGLASSVIKSIEKGDNGWLWISTNGGISSFDPSTEIFYNYNYRDGLQSNQFNPNASIKGLDGRLYFGGINGFNVFDPKAIVQNQNIPRLVFTDFKLFNKSVNVGEAIEGTIILQKPLNDNPELLLNYWQNAFSITFAALEFTNPSRNKYAYMLEGFDENWLEVGADARQANYTNLDPGTYTFLLKASNNNGVWSDEIKKLRIKIYPPFWTSWWFRLLMVLSGIGIVVGIMQFLASKRKEKHRKELMEAEKRILKLENESLAREVQQKNSELSAALLQAAHKNTELKGLREQLQFLREKEGSESKQVKDLNRLIRRINSEIQSVDYWEQFQLNFDQVHQQFSRKLYSEFPRLTQNDIRLSCLIKIGLTNKEIASIQNVSLAGIEKSKYRLKQKMNLQKEDDLNDFIFQFN